MGLTVSGAHQVGNALAVVAASTDYPSAVRAAIRMGGDTDTTAAVAGGLAGARWGAPPRRWMVDLLDHGQARSVLRRLVP